MKPYQRTVTGELACLGLITAYLVAYYINTQDLASFLFYFRGLIVIFPLLTIGCTGYGIYNGFVGYVV
jgi:hypothetical protein